MKITMIGAGYVGLVSGACFSDFGHDVIVVDKDQSKLDRLAKGVMPIYEPGLAELVKRNEVANRLSYASDLAHAVADADDRPAGCQQALGEAEADEACGTGDQDGVGHGEAFDSDHQKELLRLAAHDRARTARAD